MWNILRSELYENRSGEARKDDLDLQEAWALSESGLSSGMASHQDWASAHLTMRPAHLAMCSAYLAIVEYRSSTDILLILDYINKFPLIKFIILHL